MPGVPTRANSDRRRFLKDILGALAATGTVVLGTTVTAKPVATAKPNPGQSDDIQNRAAQIADTAGATENEQSASSILYARRAGPIRRTQENRPFGIVIVDCEGNFSTYSPELLGQASTRYGGFALGNVATNSLDSVLGLARFAQMDADIAAGERSIRRDPATGTPAGLGPTATGFGAGPRLWGLVNLGDEDTAVVLINLSFGGLAAEIDRREPDAAAPATIGELAAQIFRAFPNYTPVRVRLGPSEGCRLPAAGLLLDGDPSGKAETDMLLLISDDGSPPGVDDNSV